MKLLEIQSNNLAIRCAHKLNNYITLSDNLYKQIQEIDRKRINSSRFSRSEAIIISDDLRMEIATISDLTVVMLEMFHSWYGVERNLGAGKELYKQTSSEMIKAVDKNIKLLDQLAKQIVHDINSFIQQYGFDMDAQVLTKFTRCNKLLLQHSQLVNTREYIRFHNYLDSI